jgi:CDP-glycerol glycerophosphotransferase (TagB/SpsB family)
MKNILFIAQQHEGLKKALSAASIEASKAGNCIFILAADEKVKSMLRKQGMDFIEINDYLSYEENLRIDRFARNVAESWFKDPKFSYIFNYRNINLASVIMNGFDEYVTWIIKQYMVVKKIIQNKQIGSVIAFPGTCKVLLNGNFNDIKDIVLSEVAKKLCCEKDIPYKSILADRYVGIKSRTDLNIVIKGALKGFARIAIQLFKFVYSLRKDRSKKNILISSSYSHVKEVMDALLETKKYSLFYLREVFSIKQSVDFTLQGIEYEFFNQSKLNSKIKARLVDVWNAFSMILEGGNTFIFDGISFDQLMKSRLEVICKNTFARIAININYFYDILKRNKIDLIIVEEDVCVFNKTLILTANNLGIKSIVFKHGFLGPVREFRRAFYPLNATKIAVWGQITKDVLTSYNIPAWAIEVIGYPRLANMKNIFNKDKNSIKHRLGLSQSDKIIFYPDQGLLEEHIHIGSGSSNARILSKYISDLIKVVLSINNTQLVIKSHPGLHRRMIKMIQDSPELELLIERAKKEGKLSIIDDFDALDIIAICDLVIFDTTTVGFLALPFDKPIVHYTIMPTIKEPFYYRHNAFYNAKTESELLDAVRRALEFPDERKENRQKYAKEYFYDSPGSVSRAIKLVEDMISEK